MSVLAPSGLMKAMLSAQQHNKDVPGMKRPPTWAEAQGCQIFD